MKYTELKEGVHDPHIFKAIFMLGSPGAGKSYVANKIVGGTGMRPVNVDIFYEWLRDHQQILAKGFDDELYKYSGGLAQKQLDLYVDGRLGLVLDGTGRKTARLQQTKQMLEELGYETLGVYVDVDLLTALDRNDERKRRVDPQWLRKVHDEVQQSRSTFRQIFGQNYVEIDNTNSETLRQTLGPQEKTIRNFLSRPPKHPAAQQWIRNKKEPAKVSESYQTLDHVYAEAKEMTPEIRKHCREWFSEIDGDFALRMLRGLDASYSNITLKQTRQDRQPVDTGKERTLEYNRIIQGEGLIANRTNSIFVTGDAKFASMYGRHLYVVIPRDGFAYTYSTKYKDWYSDLMLADVPYLGQTLRGDDGTLRLAIASGHEIMINAPNGYYLLTRDHYFALEQYWSIV